MKMSEIGRERASAVARMRKIFIVGPVPPHPGGSAISIGQLAVAFGRAGHKVTVLAPITPESQSLRDDFAKDHPDLVIRRYLVPSFDLAPYLPHSEEFRQQESRNIRVGFREMVASERPDLVVSARESMAGYVPALSREHGLPVVQLVRGAPTGYLLQNRLEPAAERQILDNLRQSDLIIAVAEYLARGLRARGLANTVSLPNVIDLDAFQPGPPSDLARARLGIEADRKVVLVPANLHPRKRPLDVVEAAGRVLTHRSDLTFVLAGEGVLEEEVRTRCRKELPREAFRLPGWIPYEQMPDVMRLADLVLLPSDAEGMPRVLIEALACRRLVLASDIEASREIIQDGFNGYLFRTGDADHLARRLLEILADDRANQEVLKRTRPGVVQRSVQALLPTFLECFEKVLARHTVETE